MSDLRKEILDILDKEGSMVWEELVARFPDDAIDVDLPVAISYLREYGHIKW